EDRRLLSLTLRFEQTGFPALTVVDGDPNDSNPAVNAVNFVGSYGTFFLNITAAVSKSAADTSQNIGHIDLSDSNFASTSGGTLLLTVADTDFTIPPVGSHPLTLTNQLGGTLSGSGSITYQSWANANNLSPLPGGPPTVIPPGSTSPAVLGPFGPPAFS